MDESLGSGTGQPVGGMRASVNHASFSHTAILRKPLSSAVFLCSGRFFHPFDREKTLYFFAHTTRWLANGFLVFAGTKQEPSANTHHRP
jgi:hypothetical protein